MTLVEVTICMSLQSTKIMVKEVSNINLVFSGISYPML